jgi:hypothetical protein
MPRDTTPALRNLVFRTPRYAAAAELSLDEAGSRDILENMYATPDSLSPLIGLERDHVLGPPDAELTLVEHGSYACPRCHVVHEEKRRGLAADMLRRCDGRFINFFGELNVERISR